MSSTPSLHQTWALIAVSVILSASAQLLFRGGMMHADSILSSTTLSQWTLVLPWLQSRYALWIALGMVAYAVSLVCWLLVLKRTNLSYAYPMLSMSYVLVYYGAVYWPGLGETPSTAKLCGIGLILAGVALIAFGSNTDNEIILERNNG